jgi:hypothetical protein
MSSPQHLALGRRGEVHSGFWWGNVKDIDHLEDLGVDGRIILRWIFRKWSRGMDCIDLALDRNRWLAVVNAEMNFRVRKNAGNFLTS